MQAIYACFLSDIEMLALKDHINIPCPLTIYSNRYLFYCTCLSHYNLYLLFPPHSLMSGLAALDAKTSSRLGIITVTYYLWTTFVAVIVGIIMVSIIHPGGAAQKENTEESGKPIMSSADALLDLIR